MTGHVRPAIKRPGTFDRQFERPAQRWTGDTQDRRNIRPAVHNTVRAKNSKLLELILEAGGAETCSRCFACARFIEILFLKEKSSPPRLTA